MRTAPAPAAGAGLTECLLLEGGAFEVEGAGNIDHAMFDGMVTMQQVELPEVSANPAAVSAGGERLAAAAGAQPELAPPPAPPPAAASAGGFPGGAASQGPATEKKGKPRSFGKKKSAPAAQEFSPAMLEQLGLGMRGGCLVDVDVALPPGVTQEMVGLCTAGGHSQALSVAWLARCDNSAERALAHLRAGEPPPPPPKYRVLDRARLRAGFDAASAEAGFLSRGEVVASLEGRLNAGGVLLGLYPIVTFQYSSTTLYQFSYNIR
jgi:hypothetical protein